MMTQVLVAGGTGYFGSLLVQELLKSVAAGILVGGRHKRKLEALCTENGAGRLEPVVLDLCDPVTVRKALEGVAVAICAAGPFQRLPSTLLLHCLERGVAYLDLSDDRGFTETIETLVKGGGPWPSIPPIMSGCSAVPALAGLLARRAVGDFDRVDSLDLHIAPGNRLPRAPGTVASLLASVGKSFLVRREGRWVTVCGWSEPRTFDFPNPVGPRRGWLVDVPAHASFPDLFSAPRVEFRVGAEIGLLNRLLSIPTWLSARGLVNDWARWARPLRAGMALLGFLGSDSGAVGVEAAGTRNGSPARRRVSVVASHEGQRIPVMPAAVMAGRCLQGVVPGGLVPMDRWLTQAELEAECRHWGFDLVVEDLQPVHS
jgi:NAD(P)-dependent dehydrogenase (short-subunit alcohol dehydrogenase family)